MSNEVESKLSHAMSTKSEMGHEKDIKLADPMPNVEAGSSSVHIENTAAVPLSPEHQAYLLNRHGTIDLEPIPSSDSADPYNWSGWKKLTNLILVSFHAMMVSFTASSIIPVYENIAQDLHTSIVQASYLTSLQIAVLGFAPLFWGPMSNRYGRRPVWLISTTGSLLFNVGCALSHTYTAMAVCRAFASFFISPPMAIGSAVVTETYFQKQRAQYMGIWTLFVTLGPPMGPFLMGFVGYQTGNYRWIYWILAMINAGQFLAYLLLATETRYIRDKSTVRHEPATFRQRYLTFHRIDLTPFTVSEFVQPLLLFRHVPITVSTLAYTFVFGFCSVLLTVEIPQLFVPKFGFNPQQIGLQFLGIIVGSILGEQVGGRLSDGWMNWGGRGGRHSVDNARSRPPPEFRLWLSYAGFVLAMVGLVVFGVRFEQAAQGDWNVTPIVGIAIAAAGNQLVTTVLVTYAVDCQPERSASIGVFVNVVRSTWGFIGPFWFPDMLASLGGSGSGGLMAGIIFLFSFLPTAALQWWGGRARRVGDVKEITV